MKKLVSVIAILLSLSFVLSFSEMNIVRVDAKTIGVPDDYTTIQEAIDAASDGDTVLVKGGECIMKNWMLKSLCLLWVKIGIQR